ISLPPAFTLISTGSNASSDRNAANRYPPRPLSQAGMRLASALASASIPMPATQQKRISSSLAAKFVIRLDLRFDSGLDLRLEPELDSGLDPGPELPFDSLWPSLPAFPQGLIAPRSISPTLFAPAQNCLHTCKAWSTLKIPRALAKSLPLPAGTTSTGILRV